VATAFNTSLNSDIWLMLLITVDWRWWH